MDTLDHIMLEPEQEELLVRVVEAARNVPRDEREEFLVIRTMQRSYLHHPGIGDNDAVHVPDVEMLAVNGLVQLGFTSRGTEKFFPTPLASRYYDLLKRRDNEPVERVASTLSSFLEAEGFRRRHPSAYAKWASAQENLWRAERDVDLTTIGHLCREAMQEFADSLVATAELAGALPDKARTKTRIRAVLDKHTEAIGQTERRVLEALTLYWDALNDLVQRQEHGAIKEGESLCWEDARRTVFHTMFVMHEIDRSLSRASS